MNPDAGGYFQQLMNVVGGPQVAGRARYASRKGAEAIAANPGIAGLATAAPAIGYGVQSLQQGDYAQGVGEIAGGVVGERLTRPLAAGAQAVVSRMGTPGKIAAPLVGLGVRALGGLAGGAVGGGLAQPAAAAAQGVASAVTGQQREEGKSPSLTGGTGVGDLSSGQLAQIEELMRRTGRVGVEQQVAMMNQVANPYLDRQMQRQMQLNQQLGQLTGALNRQQYAFQLAGGAQQEAGQNLRTMMTSNPYAASTFRY